jgi:hypothetical protein
MNFQSGLERLCLQSTLLKARRFLSKQRNACDITVRDLSNVGGNGTQKIAKFEVRGGLIRQSQEQLKTVGLRLRSPEIKAIINREGSRTRKQP